MTRESFQEELATLRENVLSLGEDVAIRLRRVVARTLLMVETDDELLY